MIISLTTIDSQSVHVSWKAPTQPNGVLINYTITYTTDANGSSEATVPYEGNVSNWIFDVLRLLYGTCIFTF